MPLRNLLALTALAAIAVADAMIPAASEGAPVEAREVGDGAALQRVRPARASREAAAWLRAQGLYDDLRAKVERARYHVRRAPAAAAPEYEVANPAQALRARFTRDGLALAPGGRAPGGWRSDIRLAAYGYSGALAPVGGAEAGGSDNRVEYRHGSGLTEWYVNTPRGIEQGFTLDAAPRGGPGPLELVVAVSGELSPRAAAEAGVLHFTGGDGRPVLGYRDLHAWDARGRALPSHMAVDGGRVRLIVDDRGAAYPVTVDPLVYLAATLTPVGGGADDEFGWWVAISGKTAVVGAPGRLSSPDVAPGSVFVFVFNGGGWDQQAELFASDGQHLDAFGESVAIAGDTIVVGAPGNAPGPEMSDAGAAYVFVRGGSGDQFRSPGLLADGPSWSQQAKLVASDGAAGDSFGMAVAINGDTIVVGAPGHDPDPGSGSLPAGQAYVFERSAGSWAEKAQLVGGAGPQAAGDAFGFSVAVASGGGGKTVVVGAPFFHKTTAGPSIGRAFVFVGAGTSWTRQANLSPADGRSGDAFGFSVAISSNTVIVGAPAHDPGDKPLAGQAYVFVRSGSVWSLQSTLRASNGAAGDLFGLAVDVSLDAAVVGAPVRDTSAGTSSGQAYVFGRSGATWSQQAILGATRPAPQQFFGFGVAVDNRTVVVGAPFHDASDGAGPTYVFAPAQFLAAVWTGLKNSDDVGLRLDLKITAVVAGSPVVGEVDNIAPGGAGFSNAILQAVPLALTGSVLPSSVTVAARVSCFGAGHSTGVARLWYNGRSVDSGLLRDAGSRVELPTGRSFLVNGFVLRSTPGASQKSIDRALTSAVACDAPGGRPFTSFGTWTAPLH